MTEAFALPFFRTAVDREPGARGHPRLPRASTSCGAASSSSTWRWRRWRRSASRWRWCCSSSTTRSRSYLLALGMTFVGAALFAWLRGRARNVPLEAFIGIVFATAQAAGVPGAREEPVGARAPEGDAGRRRCSPSIPKHVAARRRALRGDRRRALRCCASRSSRSPTIRRARRRAGGGCSSGTSSSTPRSASWSRRRCRSPACCSCSASS